MLSLQKLPCEVGGCLEAAFGEDSVCPDCFAALCRKHFDDESHPCRYIHKPYRPARLQPFLDDLDGKAIRARAEELRPGHQCSIPIPATDRDLDISLCGGFNVHVPINFDDGVQWLARISRHLKGDGPVDMLSQTTESEVSTYRKLKSHGFPVAQVLDWGTGLFSKSNSQPDLFHAAEGVVTELADPLCRHIIYERVEGEACTDMTGGISDGGPSLDEMKAFIEEYAAFSIKLSEIPCEAIGSFTTDSDGIIKVGQPISRALPESLEAPFFNGPFYTLRDRYMSRIDGLIGMILKGIAFRNAPLLHYLALLEARELVESDDLFPRKEERFYIRHADSSGANVMAKDSKITALIDWEWAFTTTKAAAFASPSWAYNTDGFLAGDNAQTPEETLLCEAYERLGRADLTDCVRNGRIFHRLDDITGYWDSTWGEECTLGRLNGLTRAFRGEDSQSLKTVAEWIKWAAGKHSKAEGFDTVVAIDEEMQRTRRPAQW